MHLAGDRGGPSASQQQQEEGEGTHGRQIAGGLLASQHVLETGHVTRRRTGSVVKRPRHLDSPPPPTTTPLSPPPPPPSSSSALVVAVEEDSSSASTIISPFTKSRRGSVSTAATAPIVLAPVHPPTTLDTDHAPLPPTPPAFPAGTSDSFILPSDDQSPAVDSPPADSSKSPTPPPVGGPAAAAAVAAAKGRMPSFPLSDAYKGVPADSRRHPRDLVPLDVGFPTAEMAGKVRKEDQDDRLLMATCAVLHSHENRALCPKEVAEVMFQRNWLHNVGTTPFAHISTCIRSHLRRASTAHPPYAPLLTSFELVGALSISEVSAVGLVASDRPAVKRGALWYLDERVLGKGVGADDPFVRCRREAGLGPSELNGIYVRGLPPALPVATLGDDDGDDEGGMGRGKRKRRASSAMMAALSTDVGGSSPVSVSATPATPSPLAIPQPTRPPPPMATAAVPMPRHSRMLSSSAPVKSGGVPRLRLRLTALEEVDTSMDDSDGFTSDAARRRSKNKKKVRRATSEGMSSRAGSAEMEGMSEDDEDVDMDHPRPGAFSSASSSALLAQSLLAASTSSPHPSSSEATSSHAAVSPDSLNIGNTSSGPFSRPRDRHPSLSMSAPNLFSAFPSARSPELMEVDAASSSTVDYYSHPDAASKSEPSDEDDFHEAMLRGEEFDFEWGSESYTTAGEDEAALSLPPFVKGKPKSREMSIGLPEAFDVKDDFDALSTPATTPRSPQEELEGAPGIKMGMEATLCGVFAGLADHPAEEEADDEGQGRMLDRATSTDSLTSIVDEDTSSPVNSPPATVTRAAVDSSTLSVPLPSPLALELPPMLALGHSFAADYDFVGHEDDDRSAYRATQYERDMAESADDEEEEEDDIVTVKIEDEGSVGPEVSTAPSSRASSVYPAIESFGRRLLVNEMSSASSSSGSSDSDAFDPHMIVSRSLLATGLPVPQPAPSPPDTTDWAMHLDLDEFDGDLGSSGDLLGPEMVGLEELDLAWAGDETEEEWQERREAKARGLAAGGPSTFLTGSPSDWTPVASRTTRIAISPATSPADKGSLSTPLAYSRPTSAQSGATKAAAAAVAYPIAALSIPITSTIVERGVAVYATNVVDHDTATSFTLLRRIDVDYVNGTTLLRPTFSTPEEAISLLETIADTFHVVSGGDSIEGTWIPLPAARKLAGQFAPALGHLLPFLDHDLGQAFPSPIPELKATLMSLLASASDVGEEGQARMWGHPLFAGTVGAEEAVSGGAKAAATATAAVGKGARAGRGGRSCSSAEEGGGDAEEVLLGRVGRD